jgi:hypothetical protein
MVRTAALVVAASGVAVVILVAPTAAAAPQCAKVGSGTTQCERPGHAEIRTIPPPIGPWVRLGCVQGFTSACDQGFPGPAPLP